MSIHGSPIFALKNQVYRAKGGEDARIRREDLKFKPVRNPEAYAAAVAERERLGLPAPKRMGPEQKAIRFLTGYSRAQTAKAKGKVTLPGQVKVEKIDPREQVERQAADAVREFLVGLQGHLERIMDTPEPDRGYESSISVQIAIDAAGKLGKALRPARNFALSQPRKRMRVCIECGEPGTVCYGDGSWRCADCCSPA